MTRVGVLEVAAAHLLGDVDVDDILFEILGGAVVPPRRPAIPNILPCPPTEKANAALTQAAYVRAAQVAENPPSTYRVWPVT